MVKRQNHVQQRHAEKLELAEKKLAAGLVSEKFPQVSGISIHLTYYSDAVNPVLMVRRVNVFPSSDAYFHMQCMTKECTNGGFDLSRKIAELIKKKKKTVKGEMVCSGRGDSLSANHARISYEITVEYRK